jgi:hypothetical protein
VDAPGVTTSDYLDQNAQNVPRRVSRSLLRDCELFSHGLQEFCTLPSWKPALNFCRYVFIAISYAGNTVCRYDQARHATCRAKFHCGLWRRGSHRGAGREMAGTNAFAEIDLRMARRMGQRHENLARPNASQLDIVFYNRPLRRSVGPTRRSPVIASGL